MTSERIKEIQQETAYPNSVSVQQGLLRVWNECEQEQNKKLKSQVHKALEEAAEEIEISKIHSSISDDTDTKIHNNALHLAKQIILSLKDKY